MLEAHQFGRVPTAMIIPPKNAEGDRPTGILARMVGEDAKVYCVIAAANNENWTARPSTRLIRDVLGISGITVTRSISRLQAIGAIRAERTGRGAPYTYRITTALTAEGSSKTSALTGDHEVPSRQNRSALTAEGITDRTEKEQTGIAVVNRNLEEGRQADDSRGPSGPAPTPPGSPGSALGPQQAPVDAMVEFGVDRGVAVGLTQKIDGLSVKIVKKLAEKARGGANPAGMLVYLIRTDAPAMIAKKLAEVDADRRDRESMDAAMKRQARLAMDEYNVHEDRIKAYIESLEDDVLAREIVAECRECRTGAVDLPSLNFVRSRRGWWIQLRLFRRHKSTPMKKSPKPRRNRTARI